jgi:hypothetical protein
MKTTVQRAIDFLDGREVERYSASLTQACGSGAETARCWRQLLRPDSALPNWSACVAGISNSAEAATCGARTRGGMRDASRYEQRCAPSFEPGDVSCQSKRPGERAWRPTCLVLPMHLPGRMPPGVLDAQVTQEKNSQVVILEAR